MHLKYSRVPIKLVFSMSSGGSHDHFKFLCDKLDGRLPTFSSQSERNEEYERIDALFKEKFDDVTCRLNEDLFFWTGLREDTDSEENVFLNR